MSDTRQAFDDYIEQMAVKLERIAQWIRSEGMYNKRPAMANAALVISEIQGQYSQFNLIHLFMLAIAADKEREQTSTQPDPDPFTFKIGDGVRVVGMVSRYNGYLTTIVDRGQVGSNEDCPSGCIYRVRDINFCIAQRFLELATATRGIDDEIRSYSHL